MRKSEIKVGCTYTNGNGRIRKLIKIYERIRYQILSYGTKKNRTLGEHRVINIIAFAAWAKEVI